MDSLLKRGEVIPNFTLADTDGREVRRSEFRGKLHLALVLLPSLRDEPSRAYARELAGLAGGLQEASGMALLIVREGAGAAEARSELGLPFPVLLDEGGAVSGRLLPAGAEAGVLVVDRYAELYYSAPVASTRELPPAEDVRAWVEAIDFQCSV